MDPAIASLIVGATQAASNVGTNIANYQLYKNNELTIVRMPQQLINVQLICGT